MEINRWQREGEQENKEEEAKEDEEEGELTNKQSKWQTGRLKFSVAELHCELRLLISRLFNSLCLLSRQTDGNIQRKTDRQINKYTD